MLRSFCVVSKVIVKNGCRSYARRGRNPDASQTYKIYQGKNPGADNVVKMLKEEGVILSTNEVNLDMIEDTESNFFNAHESYEQHEREMYKKKEYLPKHIVKQKYFDEATPNLLTWSEKEQIRFLHTRDPDTWTPQKISESFPVTESSAKKLLKVTWKPASQSRIDRHDASALRNWRELKEGTLDVTPEMKEHFLKFTNRVVPPRSHENVEKTLLLKEKSNPVREYASLLQIETNKEGDTQLEKVSTKSTKNLSQIHNDSDNILTENKSTHLKLTLDEMRGDITEKVEKNLEISEYDKQILKPNSKLESLEEQSKSLYVDSFKGVPKTLQSSIDNKIDVYDYTKRIRIPKKAYKKDGTYKVQDCFYDSDGKFLYRVPGLVANFSNSSIDASSSEKE